MKDKRIKNRFIFIRDVPGFLTFWILILLLFSVRLEAQVTKLGKAVDHLSRFIASDYFKNLHEKTNDLALVDTLYLRALSYNEGDYGEALLDLAFATIPFNKIPAVVPVFKWHVNIPLPSVNDSLFEVKNRNLPRRFLFDSPINEYGDKDKLAHFFGSAYISYISRIFDFTEIIGIFVEEFESKFYVQSSVDPRDLFADYLGELFGKAIKKNKHVLPSEVITFFPLTYFRYSL